MASAHDGGGVATAEGHAATDAVSHTAAQERALTRRTRAAARAYARRASRLRRLSALPQDEGTWGPVVAWPVVGVHVALLPNGKVLAYDSIGDRATESFPVHDRTRATVFDPVTNTFTPVNVSGFNIFCSGLAHLADGTIFVAGGNKDAQLHGIRQTHIFNPVLNTWRQGPSMSVERWYPSVTPLRNGEMLITEGGPDLPEVRTTSGTLRRLTSAVRNLPLYPWLDVAPDGRAFYSGPSTTLQTLNASGTGSWQTYGQRDSVNRTYGGHALYDIGKILVAGGGPSSRDARTIDINGTSPRVTATSPMAFGRRQHNLTVLADGSVLANGGNSSGATLLDMRAGVYAAELWNPATGTWRTLASEQVTRQYHSTSLLLPDGRVLSAGGGLCIPCDANGYLAKNSQIFTPPYLYAKDGSGALAPRPSITSAPGTVSYGSAFAVSTPQAASIAKAGLVRLGAVTHSVNMEQRYVPLVFTAGAGSLSVVGPANANIAPPGIYMLFLVDSAGVPSVARMVSVAAGGSGSAPTVSLTQPANGASFTAPASVPLAASATDSDGTVSKVEFFNGATKLGEDLTSPYTFAWTGVGAGTYSLTARATDNAGLVATSAATAITVTTGTPPAGQNVARSATPTASSQNTTTGQTAAKAIDGIASGYPANPTAEWATVGQRTGAWLQLTWSSAQRLGSVTLHDRPNLDDQITSGTLAFSDGSTVPVGTLANDGSATTVTFPARSTTTLRLTITGTSAATMNIGLGEVLALTAP